MPFRKQTTRALSQETVIVSQISQADKAAEERRKRKEAAFGRFAAALNANPAQARASSMPV